MKSSRSSPGDAFTLIELVITSALMTLILTGAYLCLRSGLLSQRMVDQRVDLLQSGRIAMTRLAADLRAATSLSKDFDFLGTHRTLAGHDADNLDFATHNHRPRRPGESDWSEVSYFLDRGRHSPSLSLWRRSDPLPDDKPLDGGAREEIAPDVRSFTLEYYDGYEWYSDWGDPDGKRTLGSNRQAYNLSGFPEAVRITLVITPARQTLGADTNAPAPPRNSTEPPLVLQTIVHLGAAHQTTGTSGSGSGSATGAPSSTSSPGSGGSP